ncbi:MAG TPA: indole-3-glycerol phosphate synthase TrpC [Puia sp.]|jgi:indole-3-glycerol phosphate synthase|nr:indole-3-glycerol phosphate synthase TrpC [Puia sp.]
MENILEKIVSYKKEEIKLRKVESPVHLLEKQPGFNREIFSMKKFLMDPEKNGIVAEFKKKSPSKGIINNTATVERVTAAYAQYGASMISVLTDLPSFGGSTEDLKLARFNKLPVLRKDFILDPYQIVESRAMGADVILLIAACLQPAETRSLAKKAHKLGLEVLLEIHEESEFDHLCEDVDVVGINNRDLKTFTVDINRSIQLAERLPFNLLHIAESGIRNIETILHLKTAGFNGFLIGEQFMKEPDPAIAFASFVDQLKKKLYESESLRNDATRSGKEA